MGVKKGKIHSQKPLKGNNQEEWKTFFKMETDFEDLIRFLRKTAASKAWCQ